MQKELKLEKALQKGNVSELKKIFEEIYNQYYNLVYFTIKKIIPLKEDIEDLTNETFVSFFSYLKEESKIQSISNYLCQIARNTAFNFLSRNPIEIEEFNENQFSEIDRHDFDLFDSLKAILTSEEYLLLIEHLIYDKSLRQIAREHGESSNTIKSQYRRIKKKVRDKLGGKYGSN